MRACSCVYLCAYVCGFFFTEELFGLSPNSNGCLCHDVSLSTRKSPQCLHSLGLTTRQATSWLRDSQCLPVRYDMNVLFWPRGEHLIASSLFYVELSYILLTFLGLYRKHTVSCSHRSIHCSTPSFSHSLIMAAAQWCNAEQSAMSLLSLSSVTSRTYVVPMLVRLDLWQTILTKGLSALKKQPYILILWL